MWITTKDGFYSVVKHNSFDDAVIIRARSSADAERFCIAVGLSVDCVEYDGEADYVWRIGQTQPISRDILSDYLVSAVFDIDYESSCKKVMSTIDGVVDKARYNWYLDAWRGGFEYQEDKENQDYDSDF